MRSKEECREIVLNDGAYYCHHISEKDKQDVELFECKDDRGKGLLLFLRRIALENETRHSDRTYIVRSSETDELVGFFSLKAGMISANESSHRFTKRRTFDTFPGVEISNFAVNNAYIREHPGEKGVGVIIFTDFILKIVKDCAEQVGLRVLYIFALPYDSLIKRYESEYGFMRLDKKDEKLLHLRMRPRYDKGCIFMYRFV